MRRRETKRWQQRGARRTGGTGSYIGASARLQTQGKREGTRRSLVVEGTSKKDGRIRTTTDVAARNLRAPELRASREMHRRALALPTRASRRMRTKPRDHLPSPHSFAARRVSRTRNDVVPIGEANPTTCTRLRFVFG